MKITQIQAKNGTIVKFYEETKIIHATNSNLFSKGIKSPTIFCKSKKELEEIKTFIKYLLEIEI